MITLIWKNISRRRLQSLLTISITTLTILVFVLIMGILQVVTQGLKLSQERLGADAMLIPKYASATGSDLLFTAVPENIYMSIDTLEQAKQLEGVAAASAQFYAQTYDMNCCDAGDELRIVGYDPATDFVLTPYLSDNQRHVEPGEIIVGSNFNSIFVGYDYLLLGYAHAVISQIQPTGTGMDDMYFMHADTLRELCLTSEMLSNEWIDRDPYDYISVIMIKFAEGTDPAAFVEMVEKSDMECRVVLTGETITSLQDQLETVMQVLFFVWVAALLIAMLALIGRFNSLAKERKKEIGLLRAIGLKKGQVFGLIIGETCTMALLGGILGSSIALMCMETVIQSLKEAFKLSPSIWNSSLATLCGVTGVILAGVLGFAAAVVPAMRSASMDPQTAITQGEVN